MNDMFELLDEDELGWLDDFLLLRIDEDTDTKGKDEGVLNLAELDGVR